MNSFSQKILRSAACALAITVASSCIQGQKDDTGSILDGSTDVWLSQTEVDFGMYGGQAAIQIKSGIPLLFKNPLSTDDSDRPTASAMDSYFAGNGKPMTLSPVIIDDMLLIQVNKSELRQNQCDSILLYDQTGKKRASVKVTLAGNPTISNELGLGGKQIVDACQHNMGRAMAQILFTESCYTGFIDNAAIKRPMTLDNMYNVTAYNEAVNAINYVNGYIKALTDGRVGEEIPYYVFLKSVLYTEMADKWGNLPVFEAEQPEQLTPTELLGYARSGLDSISEYFADRKSWGYATSPETAYRPTKDVWRVAMAHIDMRLGEYARAAEFLRQITESRRYDLTPDNRTELNTETVWMFDLVQSPGSENRTVYYSYPDVLLMLAECHHRLGDTAAALAIVNELASAKDIQLQSSDIMANMELLRQCLCQPHYLAFQKRNSRGGYEQYQYLWPIPKAYIGNMQQNPGYN